MSDERQSFYTIAEGCELPSKGLIYNKQINPHVDLRSRNTMDELKRLSPSTTPLKTLSDIIEGCRIEKPARRVYDMALGDYEFLLHKLRIITYGGDYKMAVVCPNCGSTVDATVNLETLKIKPFNKDTFVAAESILLPKSQKTISLNFTTPRRLDEISLKAKEDKRQYPEAVFDFNVLEKLKFAIDLVDGVKLNEFELENFIKNLPAADMRKVLDGIIKIDSRIGVDNTIYVTCPVCGEDIKTFFRLNNEFFRPTTL